MNWDYIAGFFDGEGSIVSISSKSYRISFAQNNIDVLVEIKKFLDKYNIHSWMTKKKPKKEYPNNIGYHLAFSKSTNVRLFLDNIRCLSIVKHKQIEDALGNLTNRVNNVITPEQETDIIIMRIYGLSQREIASRVGVSQYAVNRRLKKHAVH